MAAVTGGGGSGGACPPASSYDDNAPQHQQQQVKQQQVHILQHEQQSLQQPHVQVSLRQQQYNMQQPQAHVLQQQRELQQKSTQQSPHQHSLIQQLPLQHSQLRDPPLEQPQLQQQSHLRHLQHPCMLLQTQQQQPLQQPQQQQQQQQPQQKLWATPMSFNHSTSPLAPHSLATQHQLQQQQQPLRPSHFPDFSATTAATARTTNTETLLVGRGSPTISVVGTTPPSSSSPASQQHERQEQQQPQQRRASTNDGLLPLTGTLQQQQHFMMQQQHQQRLNNMNTAIATHNKGHILSTASNWRDPTLVKHHQRQQQQHLQEQQQQQQQLQQQQLQQQEQQQWSSGHSSLSAPLTSTQHHQKQEKQPFFHRQQVLLRQQSSQHQHQHVPLQQKVQSVNSSRMPSNLLPTSEHTSAGGPSDSQQQQQHRQKEGGMHLKPHMQTHVTHKHTQKKNPQQQHMSLSQPCTAPPRRQSTQQPPPLPAHSQHISPLSPCTTTSFPLLASNNNTSKPAAGMMSKEVTTLLHQTVPTATVTAPLSSSAATLSAEPSTTISANNSKTAVGATVIGPASSIYRKQEQLQPVFPPYQQQHQNQRQLQQQHLYKRLQPLQNSFTVDVKRDVHPLNNSKITDICTADVSLSSSPAAAILMPSSLSSGGGAAPPMGVGSPTKNIYTTTTATTTATTTTITGTLKTMGDCTSTTTTTANSTTMCTTVPTVKRREEDSNTEVSVSVGKHVGGGVSMSTVATAVPDSSPGWVVGPPSSSSSSSLTSPCSTLSSASQKNKQIELTATTTTSTSPQQNYYYLKQEQENERSERYEGQQQIPQEKEQQQQEVRSVLQTMKGQPLLQQNVCENALRRPPYGMTEEQEKQRRPNEQQVMEEEQQENLVFQHDIEREQLESLRLFDPSGRFYSAFCRLLYEFSLRKVTIVDRRIRILLLIFHWLRQQPQEQFQPAVLFRGQQYERLLLQAQAYMQMLTTHEPLQQQQLHQLLLSKALGFSFDSRFAAAVQETSSSNSHRRLGIAQQLSPSVGAPIQGPPGGAGVGGSSSNSGGKSAIAARQQQLLLQYLRKRGRSFFLDLQTRAEAVLLQRDERETCRQLQQHSCSRLFSVHSGLSQAHEGEAVVAEEDETDLQSLQQESSLIQNVVGGGQQKHMQQLERGESNARQQYFDDHVQDAREKAMEETEKDAVGVLLQQQQQQEQRQTEGHTVDLWPCSKKMPMMMVGGGEEQPSGAATSAEASEEDYDEIVSVYIDEDDVNETSWWQGHAESMRSTETEEGVGSASAAGDDYYYCYTSPPHPIEQTKRVEGGLGVVIRESEEVGIRPPLLLPPATEADNSAFFGLDNIEQEDGEKEKKNEEVMVRQRLWSLHHRLLQLQRFQASVQQQVALERLLEEQPAALPPLLHLNVRTARKHRLLREQRLHAEGYHEQQQQKQQQRQQFFAALLEVHRRNFINSHRESLKLVRRVAAAVRRRRACFYYGRDSSEEDEAVAAGRGSFAAAVLGTSRSGHALLHGGTTPGGAATSATDGTSASAAHANVPGSLKFAAAAAAPTAHCGHHLHPVECGCPAAALYHAAIKRRERLAALKKHDETAYLALLQETKNERLLQLVQQTEEYMRKIGDLVIEQREREGGEVKLEPWEVSLPLSPPMRPSKPATGKGEGGEGEGGEGGQKRAKDGQDEQQQQPQQEQEAGGVTSTDKNNEASTSLSSFLLSKERYYRLTHAKKVNVVQLPQCLKGGGALRAYQMEGLNWMASLYENGLNGILADSMGLGKTVQTVAFLAYLFEVKRVRRPFLIVAPLSTIHSNWRQELKKWWPGIRLVVYEGTKEYRKQLRSRIVGGGLTVPAVHRTGGSTLLLSSSASGAASGASGGAAGITAGGSTTGSGGGGGIAGKKGSAGGMKGGAGVSTASGGGGGSSAAQRGFVQPFFQALLTTDAIILRDKSFLRKIEWECLVVDEAHRLKNPNSKLVQTLNTGFHIKRRLALTGTPLQNDIVEVWALLNFLLPSIFNAKLNFEQWLNVPLATPSLFGGSGSSHGSSSSQQEEHLLHVTEEEKLLIVDRLHKVLRPFLLRREKAEVADELPSKQEEIVWCPLSGVQRLLYRMIESNPLGQNRMMQLRKLCNHPYLFCYSNYTPDESLVRCCGKFAMLDLLLPALKMGQHRVLIFSQMTRLLDLLEVYLSLRLHKYLRLDGGTTSEERQKRLSLYNQENSDFFIFILSTKAGGLGVNLQSADTVIIFDSDWNPQNDEQAQSRAHRIGQKKEVLTLRFVTVGSIEEQILQSAECKLDKDRLVIQSGMYYGHGEDDMQSNATREIERTNQVREILRKQRQQEANMTRAALDLQLLKRQISRTPEDLRVFERADRLRKLLHVPGLILAETFPPCLFTWSKATDRTQETLVHGEQQRKAAEDMWKHVYSMYDFWVARPPRKPPLSLLPPTPTTPTTTTTTTTTTVTTTTTNSLAVGGRAAVGAAAAPTAGAATAGAATAVAATAGAATAVAATAVAVAKGAASITTFDSTRAISSGDGGLQAAAKAGGGAGGGAAITVAASAGGGVEGLSPPPTEGERIGGGQEVVALAAGEGGDAAAAAGFAAAEQRRSEIAPPAAETKKGETPATSVKDMTGRVSYAQADVHKTDVKKEESQAVTAEVGGGVTRRKGSSSSTAPTPSTAETKGSADNTAANGVSENNDAKLPRPQKEPQEGQQEQEQQEKTQSKDTLQQKEEQKQEKEKEKEKKNEQSAAQSLNQKTEEGKQRNDMTEGRREGKVEDIIGSLLFEREEQTAAGILQMRKVCDLSLWRRRMNACIAAAVRAAAASKDYDIFVELPSKEYYKDYFERVKKPVCLLDILRAAESQEFASIHKLEKYLTRLAENARVYNGADSPIFLRAVECMGLIIRESRRRLCVAYQELLEGGKGPVGEALKTKRFFDVVFAGGGAGGGGSSSGGVCHSNSSLHMTGTGGGGGVAKTGFSSDSGVLPSTSSTGKAPATAEGGGKSSSSSGPHYGRPIGSGVRGGGSKGSISSDHRVRKGGGRGGIGGGIGGGGAGARSTAIAAVGRKAINASLKKYDDDEEERQEEEEEEAEVDGGGRGGGEEEGEFVDEEYDEEGSGSSSVISSSRVSSAPAAGSQVSRNTSVYSVDGGGRLSSSSYSSPRKAGANKTTKKGKKMAALSKKKASGGSSALVMLQRKTTSTGFSSSASSPLSSLSRSKSSEHHHHNHHHRHHHHHPHHHITGFPAAGFPATSSPPPYVGQQQQDSGHRLTALACGTNTDPLYTSSNSSSSSIMSPQLQQQQSSFEARLSGASPLLGGSAFPPPASTSPPRPHPPSTTATTKKDLKSDGFPPSSSTTSTNTSSTITSSGVSNTTTTTNTNTAAAFSQGFPYVGNTSPGVGAPGGSSGLLLLEQMNEASTSRLTTAIGGGAIGLSQHQVPVESSAMTSPPSNLYDGKFSSGHTTTRIIRGGGGRKGRPPRKHRFAATRSHASSSRTSVATETSDSTPAASAAALSPTSGGGVPGGLPSSYGIMSTMQQQQHPPETGRDDISSNAPSALSLWGDDGKKGNHSTQFLPHQPSHSNSTTTTTTSPATAAAATTSFPTPPSAPSANFGISLASFRSSRPPPIIGTNTNTPTAAANTSTSTSTAMSTSSSSGNSSSRTLASNTTPSSGSSTTTTCTPQTSTTPDGGTAAVAGIATDTDSSGVTHTPIVLGIAAATAAVGGSSSTTGIATATSSSTGASPPPLLSSPSPAAAAGEQPDDMSRYSDTMTYDNAGDLLSLLGKRKRERQRGMKDYKKTRQQQTSKSPSLAALVSAFPLSTAAPVATTTTTAPAAAAGSFLPIEGGGQAAWPTATVTPPAVTAAAAAEGEASAAVAAAADSSSVEKRRIKKARTTTTTTSPAVTTSSGDPSTERCEISERHPPPHVQPQALPPLGAQVHEPGLPAAASTPTTTSATIPSTTKAFPSVFRVRLSPAVGTPHASTATGAATTTTSTTTTDSTMAPLPPPSLSQTIATNTTSAISGLPATPAVPAAAVAPAATAAALPTSPPHDAESSSAVEGAQRPSQQHRQQHQGPPPAVPRFRIRIAGTSTPAVAAGSGAGTGTGGGGGAAQ